MIYFEASSRDNFEGGKSSVCNTCCTEFVDGVPGETNKWRISYADWLAGIQATRGIFDLDIAFLKLTPNPSAPFPDMLPPTNTDYQFQIEANISFAGTVSTNAVSPQSSPLSYALDPVNPPQTGAVAMNSNGTFIYVPQAGFVGIDSFAFVTTDGVNTPLKNIVTFGVDTVVASNFMGPLPSGVINPSAPEDAAQVYETPLPPSQGLIYVPKNSIQLRHRHIDFGLTVSPECLIGQIYRMTLAVSALECDKSVYRHISSYDIRISKCGLP